MGQYFNVITKELTGKVTVYNGESPETMREIEEFFYRKDPEEIEKYNLKINEFTGVNKLMEYTWWEDKFVGRLCRKLLHNPTQVAFVGEYALDYETDEETTKPNELGMEVIKELFHLVWSEGHEEVLIEDCDMLILDEVPGYYLVNHTKKTYLNCLEYKAAYDDEDDVEHPLPILTAVGNGLSCSDYEGPDENKAGSWAYDVISVETVAPEDYTEEHFCFVE